MVSNPSNNPIAETAAAAGKLAYSIPQLAELTSISRAQIYVEIREGRLRLTKKGKRSIVTDDDARAWLKAAPRSAA